MCDLLNKLNLKQKNQFILKPSEIHIIIIHYQNQKMQIYCVLITVT